MAEGLIEQHLEQNQPVAKVLHGQKRSEPKESYPRLSKPEAVRAASAG
jgi:hypothetical protein